MNIAERAAVAAVAGALAFQGAQPTLGADRRAQSLLTPDKVAALLVKNPSDQSKVTCSTPNNTDWKCGTSDHSQVTFTHPGNGETMSYWSGFNAPQNAATCNVTTDTATPTRFVVCPTPGATFSADQAAWTPKSRTLFLPVVAQPAAAPSAQEEQVIQAVVTPEDQGSVRCTENGSAWICRDTDPFKSTATFKNPGKFTTAEYWGQDPVPQNVGPLCQVTQPSGNWRVFCDADSTATMQAEQVTFYLGSTLEPRAASTVRK